MSTFFEVIGYVIGTLALFLASTVAFDVVHWLLHRAQGSRFAVVRDLGALHATHHRLLDRELRIHPELIGANIRRHVVPEFLTQVGFSVVLLALLPWSMVAGAFALQLAVFVWIMSDRGLDINHRGFEKLPPYRATFMCMPEYHALHHVNPGAHFSSWVKALDYILLSGLELDGKKVAWRGEAADWVGAVELELRRHGASRIDAKSDGDWESVDVLAIVGDGTAPAVSREIEAFQERAAARRIPPEIWFFDTTGKGTSAPRSRDVISRRLRVSGTGAPDLTAQRLVRGLRRGWNFVSDRSAPHALGDYARHRGWAN